MSDLLAEVVRAHGGLERWQRFTTVQASIVSGGDLSGMKGLVQDPAPREMTVWLHEGRASMRPYGAPDQRTSFMPGRIAIEKLDGRVVAGRTTHRWWLRRHPIRVRDDRGRHPPAVKRLMYQLSADHRALLNPLMVSIHCSQVKFSWTRRAGSTNAGR